MEKVVGLKQASTEERDIVDKLKRWYRAEMEDSGTLVAFAVVAFHASGDTEQTLVQPRSHTAWYTNLWPAPLFGKLAAAQIESIIQADCTIDIARVPAEGTPDAG